MHFASYTWNSSMHRKNKVDIAFTKRCICFKLLHLMRRMVRPVVGGCNSGEQQYKISSG